jgi:ankyrin repeat protein
VQPLHLAAEKGHKELIVELVRAGAQPDCKDQVWSGTAAHPADHLAASTHWQPDVEEISHHVSSTFAPGTMQPTAPPGTITSSSSSSS